MKNYVLYNPLAGHGKGLDYLETLKEMLDGELVMQDITSIKNFGDFLSTLAEDDVITICGGDGTLNKFINCTDTDSIKNKIYYYGAGSGNDFLNDVAPDAKDKVLEINKYLKNLPTVEINGNSYKFINGIGYGIDGYCCEVGDELKTKSDKPVDYTMIAIKGLLFHFKPRPHADPGSVQIPVPECLRLRASGLKRGYRYLLHPPGIRLPCPHLPHPARSPGRCL